MEGADHNAELLVTGGTLLLETGDLATNESLVIEGGNIQAIGSTLKKSACFDATGLLVLPGVIDLHGDAFERQLMPRPGVHFPHALALLETDRQLLANGITTAYHGLTWSWEPGLRGKEAAYAFLGALNEVRGQLGCDTRLHLRFETHNLDDLEDVAGCLASGQVDLLAFNDHIDYLRDELTKPGKAGTLAGRTGMSVEAFRNRVEALSARAEEIPAALSRLAKLTRGRIPMASHDDDTAAIRAWYRGLGCRIAEFPTTPEATLAAKVHGDHVVMGAPNVLRGKSHTNSLMNARSAVAEGLCDILTSDYYYPALIEAPFVLEREGTPLAQAWKLVSTNPAEAAGLSDRGRIALGRRADLVFVDADGQHPRALAVLSNGRFVYAAPDAFRRMTYV